MPQQNEFGCNWERFLGIPKKVTYYGTPDDSFVRIEDTYRREGDQIVIDRKVTLKEPLKYIRLEIP